MTETTNSPAPASESALSHPLTLDDAANLDLIDPEEDNETVEASQQSDETTGEAVEGQETEEIEAVEEGAEEGAAGDDTPKPEPTDDVHITVNGEKVPLSEVKLGYMRQADYSRKTQEVASRRKGLEEMIASAEARIDAVAAHLAGVLPPEPDAHLAMTNPAEYVQKMAMHNAAVAKFRDLMAQAGEVKAVAAKLTEEQLSDLKASENAKLNETFPQTRSPEGRKAFFEAGASAAKSVGYSDEEIGQVMDHRLFALAHYAQLGMQAEKAREKAKVKTQNAPPVAPQKARPQGAAQTAARRNQEGMKRLARTGSIDDAMSIDWA
jgi:hypothetical protein